MNDWTPLRLRRSALMPPCYYRDWVTATAPHATLMNTRDHGGMTRNTIIADLEGRGLIPRQLKPPRVMIARRPTPPTVREEMTRFFDETTDHPKEMT